MALSVAAAGMAGLPAQAVPTEPGNIEIFTKRDMVAIEGYSEYAGKTAEISVWRNGVEVGNTKGTVDGTGFLEVNHPGGVCWGASTNLQVTPDIQGGDEVRVTFSGIGVTETAKAQPVKITTVSSDEEEFTLTLAGEYGAGVDMPGTDLVADPGRFGIEIVNPDMRGGTSAVGERAIGWPVEAGETTTGYTVTGTVQGTDEAGGTFSVTYDFETATDLELALAGEHVALAWEADHPDPNQELQLGLTMWENGEFPGPGFGGCPASPQGMRADSPTVFWGKGGGTGAIQADWAAADVAPDAPLITGYSVRAVSTAGDEVGKRIPADATTATLTGLVDGDIYTVEIAARNDNGESSPVASMRIKAGPFQEPGAETLTARMPNADDKYLPLVTTAAGADYGVHLKPFEGLVDPEVFYTTDGSEPTLSSPTFELDVTPSIQIRTDTTVRWLVMDAGNIQGTGSKFFDIIESTDPAPEITEVAATPVSSTVDVTFTRLTDPRVGAYRVQAYDESGTIRVGNPVSVAQPTDPAVTEVVRRVGNLTNGTKYKFTVAARYGTMWSAESDLSAAVAPEAAAKADAGVDQSVLRGRQFVLDGGASPKAVSWQWTQVRPNTANNGGFPQDPALDLNPAMSGVQATTGTTTEPTLTLRFPLLTTPTSDHNLLFRLTTVHSDGSTKYDTVEIKGQADTVTAEENRWRTGDEIGGTGSQENAVLTLMNGSPTGTVIGQVVITNGEWEYPGGAPALLNGTIYVWSDYGYTGSITTTN